MARDAHNWAQTYANSIEVSGLTFRSLQEVADFTKGLLDSPDTQVNQKAIRVSGLEFADLSKELEKSYARLAALQNKIKTARYLSTAVLTDFPQDTDVGSTAVRSASTKLELAAKILQRRFVQYVENATNLSMHCWIASMAEPPRTISKNPVAMFIDSTLEKLYEFQYSAATDSPKFTVRVFDRVGNELQSFDALSITVPDQLGQLQLEPHKP